MADFSATFAELRAVLQPYADRLEVKADSRSAFYLDTRFMHSNGKPLFFAAVRVNKNYVSFHLMPVYVEPRLLEGISVRLKKRMQGKSCFNFKEIDRTLISELAALTRAGYAHYKKEGFV